MTNGDIIRQMTDEELATFITDIKYQIIKPLFDYLGYGITIDVLILKMLVWVKSEAEGEGKQ